MPVSGRKGHNVAPSRDQFRELQRLLLLFVVVSDELGNRIGYHLPVSLLDRLTHFTHRKCLASIRSKLDDWACRAGGGSHASMSVFYPDDNCRAHNLAVRLVQALLADGSETLPPGFLGGDE
jgi:hypothetical protein